jgi:hypothetical protein
MAGIAMFDMFTHYTNPGVSSAESRNKRSWLKGFTDKFFQKLIRETSWKPGRS